MNLNPFGRNTKFFSSEEGLTSVITTVLIIAIIMGLIIGPYLTIIVPQQIEKNEEAHLEGVEDSFLDLRAAINTELDTGTPNMVLTTPIKLGTDDENMFVLGGTGDLNVDPSETIISVYNYYDPLSIYARGSGKIKYKSRNLYYLDKTYTYEAGGVIVDQKGTSIMDVGPNYKITTRRVISSLGLDAAFGTVSGVGTNRLYNIYLINTKSAIVEFNRAKVSWVSGNATKLTLLNIGSGSTIEWTGNQESGDMFNFTNNFTLGYGVETMNLQFNADIRDASITIELFSTDNKEISDTWPDSTRHTIAHPYDIDVPSENSTKKFLFRNIGTSATTIKNIAVSWAGSATLWKIYIENHGEIVWRVLQPGIESPVYVNITKDSIFNPDEQGEVKLYFDGPITGKELNIKFFAENSSNTATAQFPINLNRTYINSSFSMVSLVTETGDKITSSGKSSKIIKNTLISSENNRYIWESGETIIFNITTSNGNAWADYFNESLVEGKDLIWDNDGEGAFPGDYYITTTQLVDNQVNVKLIINSIYKMDCKIGIVKVDVG